MLTICSNRFSAAMRKPNPIVAYTSAFFFGLYLMWALWQQFLLPQIPSPLAAVLLSICVIKPLVWGLFPCAHYYLQKGSLPKNTASIFAPPFPVLPCITLICLTTAFLHTIRLLLGLGNNIVFFDWMFILISLSAGVFEEYGFRGYFFNVQEPFMGFWPAAVLNAVMFTLYHYPEILFGASLSILISWRGLLIFCMGIVFCRMFHKWRNLALNMIVHTVWDILSFLFCLA